MTIAGPASFIAGLFQLSVSDDVQIQFVYV